MRKKMNIVPNTMLLILGTFTGLLSAQTPEISPVSETLNNAVSLSGVDVKPLSVNQSRFEKIRAEKEYGHEYFPLLTDKVYHFTSNVGDTKAEFKPDGAGITLVFDAPGMEYRQTLLPMEGGIFLTRTKTSAFMFFGNDIRYTEPVLRIPFPVKKGDAWEWHAFETEDEDTTKLTIKGRVIGEEFVSTPAGRFKSLKIRQYIHSEGGSSNILTEWFAPRVGLVKSHAILQGQGITGMIQDLLGLDEVRFELAAVDTVISE
jgi:hypothetical protein